MIETDTTDVHENIQDAILAIECRIGSDDETATDQDVLQLLNEADRLIRQGPLTPCHGSGKVDS